MIGKIVLNTLVIFIALSGAVVAGAERGHPHSSTMAASRPTVDRFNSFDWGASPARPSAYRYHGGPKSNDTIDTH
jgi:hypothetical protein